MQDERVEYRKEKHDEKYMQEQKVMKWFATETATVESVMTKARRCNGLDFKSNNPDLMSVVKAVCAKYGRVFVAENNHSNNEIVCFAQRNPRVLAIMSNERTTLIFCFSQAIGDFSRVWRLN